MGNKYAGGNSRRTRDSERARRQDEALERGRIHAKRTPIQQLEELDRRLGRDKGAARERARLEALINASRRM